MSEDLFGTKFNVSSDECSAAAVSNHHTGKPTIPNRRTSLVTFMDINDVDTGADLSPSNIQASDQIKCVECGKPFGTRAKYKYVVWPTNIRS